MKKKNLIISLLTLGGMLLSSCMLAREKQDLVWSKWYDNGDGTHTRHNLNDISQTETDVHHFTLTSSIEEPTEVTPGKAIYTCEQCACKEEKVVPPTGNYVFNQKVVSDKYLLERYSEHSACYYMSSIEGAFGDPRYVFEESDIPSGYTEVDYVESDGRQWVDTGVKNNGVNKVNINNGSRLGMDYTELEYIESTGTQFIKTGVKGEAKWTITIEFTSLDSRQLMGYNGSGANYWGVAEENTVTGTQVGDYESGDPWIGHPKAGNKDVIIDDFGDTTEGKITRYLNGALAYNLCPISGSVSAVDYELFALDNGNYSCSAKLYSAKVEKKGELTNEFVPAKRNSDGAVGLFDIVTYNFLENKGTGAFKQGAEIYNVKNELPEEYQELEYLEATGTQTINLNTPFDLEHGSFEIDFQSTVANQTGMIIGNYFGDYNINYIWLYHYCHHIQTITIFLNGNGNGNPQFQQNLSDNPPDVTKHNAKYKNKTFILDGAQKGSAIGTLGVCDNLYLFSSGSGYYYQGKVFNLKMDNGNGLVRNLVPCYRISDGVNGMYDLISNLFFTNSGTGEFVRGPEVEKTKPLLPLEYQQVEYVRSDGNQWINANVIYNNGDTAAQIVDVQFLDTTMHWCGANWYLQYGFSSDYVSTHDRVTLQEQYANRKLSVFVNGAAKGPYDFTASSIPANIGTGVFRLMNNNGAWYETSSSASDEPSSQILYSLKIYKNNVLERDFVPCYKKANDEVGLFDLVSGSFFANEGTSPLIKGDDVNVLDDSRDYNALEQASIPDYYYQLNYIESNGLQSLDTGVVGGAKIDTTLKFTRNNSMQIMGYSDTGGHFFGVGSDNKYLATSIEAGNVDHIIADVSNTTANAGTIKINDEEQSNFAVPDLGENSLKLFSVGTAANKCVCLMYGVKIYQGDTLVRDFIPVLLKPTGAVGLYDLVNQRFYESTTSYPFEAGGIMYSGLNTANINVFCNLNSNKAHPQSTKISSYKVYERNEVVRDLVSAIRNSDGVAGLYDLKNNEFYTSNSEFPLRYGKIIGHKLDEGRISKKPTYNEQGEMIYKCVYTGEEIRVKTDCTAFKVTFLSNNGNLNAVKIFNNNDPGNYYLSMVGYTRNVNTFNYSKYGTYIWFEIPDDGNEYVVETTSGKVKAVEDEPRQYRITGIAGDAFIQLRVK